ncbi:MAG: SapC family protein [Woeseiaceae bacterium]
MDENGWNARYVPAIQQRGPFLIGLQKYPDEADRQDPMVQVDLDHPRISHSEGEPLFLPHGGNSPYLDRISRVLQVIYRGTPHIRPMFAAFEDAGLIESVDLNIELDRTTKYKLQGYLTLSQDRLNELDQQQLERLNKAGYLQLAMLAAASLGNVSWLIELKNRRRAAERA